MLELTATQIAAIEAQAPTPVQIVNPTTQEVFVLIRKDVYDLARSVIGGGKGEVWDDDADDDLIAPRATVRDRA